MIEKILPDTYISHLRSLERRELDAMDEQYVISGISSYSSEGEIPRLKGFVRSSFSPLIYESILKAWGQAGVSADTPCPEKRGVIAGSMFTDAVTEQETWKDMLEGKRLSPIMFPQSVPSAIVGYAASSLNIHGPMTCISLNHPYSPFYMLRQAWDWLREGDAELVVLTFCDVPSIRREDWMKKQNAYEAGLKDGSISFMGGATSMIMEAGAQAIERQVQRIMSIKEALLQLLSAPINHAAASHSMDVVAAAHMAEIHANNG